VLVRLERELGPVGSSGDTTVSHLCSPSGISAFFSKPRTSVENRRALAWSSTSTLMTLSFMVSPRWSVAGQRSLIWRSGEVSSWWSL
jgi:hypothetical protein